jgi:hypothetical protein
MKYFRFFIRFSPLLIVFLISAMSMSAMSAENSCPKSAQDYWTKFRKSVLNSNLVEVSRQSRFPFKIRGDLDSNEVKQLNRNEFILKLPDLLNTDPGLSAKPSTMRCLIKKTSSLNSFSCNARGNQFRIGTWLFDLTPDGWMFVRAFVEE